MASENAPLAHAEQRLAIQSEPSALISTLAYRSRAVTAMSELDLHRLARAAQLRNGAEGVTGLMVYDSGWIFQQLEGPADGVARIWASICRDRRHCQIDVLINEPSDQRQFLDWDLKLSVRGAQAGLGQAGMADEPPDVIVRLCRGERPEDSPVVSWPKAYVKQSLGEVSSPALIQYEAALREVIATVIVPLVRAARPVSTTRPESQTAALAALVIAVDEASAFAFVEATLDRYLSLGSLARNLLEPVARELGDLWQSDDCGEIEVTLGLTRLQAIARYFCRAPRLKALRPPVVLVVPQPGEAHMLGAILDAEMLWQAGWNPQVDFPSCNSALDTLVANTWIDALDLSLSSSFRRDHRLDQLGKTIAKARLASLNPEMVVVVSGRVFSDVDTTSEAVVVDHHIGADATFGSASEAEAIILQALNRPRRD